MKLPIKNKISKVIGKQINGAGDLVAAVADPIKKALKATNLKPVIKILDNCNCNKRREDLNNALPFT